MTFLRNFFGGIPPEYCYNCAVSTANEQAVFIDAPFCARFVGDSVYLQKSHTRNPAAFTTYEKLCCRHIHSSASNLPRTPSRRLQSEASAAFICGACS